MARPAAHFALLLALHAAPVLAQSYEVQWWTVDGGGGASASGAYALTGTVGQPDAGGPFTGSTFVLRSGFWSIHGPGAAGPQADLVATKTDGAATAVPGDTVTYTMTVTNLGPAAASGAAVTDPTPAALQDVSWTCAASNGSTCPASGTGPIVHLVNLAAGGTLTYSLTATIGPAATGALANTLSVTAPSGINDPSLANNAATDTDTLTPRADLAVSIADSPDPVAPGQDLTYTVTVANVGQSRSSGAGLLDRLPAATTFLALDPPVAFCAYVAATHAVECDLSAIDPGAQSAVGIRVRVGAGATGTLTNTATVTGLEPDPVAGNDTGNETTTIGVRARSALGHGSNQRAELGGAGMDADVDYYRVAQAPHASYEVVVDATSGDIGGVAGVELTRVEVDGVTVVGTSVGSGPSRSLRWANTGSTAVQDQYVRVRSQRCGSDCGADDVYRIRAWETTVSVPRFNNSGSQVTVLILQNLTSSAVNGRIQFWSPAGALLLYSGFGLAPRGVTTVNTSTLAGLLGVGGSITLTSDAPYGQLAGKAVSLEPATGFSFDSPLVARPR